MKRYRRRLFIDTLLGALSLASLSCSVLEDRGECLCLVEIFPGEVYKGEMAVSFWHNSAHMFSEGMLLEPRYRNTVLRTELSRGMNRVCAVWSPDKGCCLGSDCILIPFGRQADSLYVYENVIDCRGDSASDTVVLHKQFASLRIHFEKSSFSSYPYFAVVESNVCGISLPDLRPVEGRFEYFLYINEEMAADCRLPRQGDTGLKLHLYRNIDGTSAYVFPLDDALKDAGYSWSSYDLDDIEVWVDCMDGSFVVNVQPWEMDDMGEINI